MKNSPPKILLVEAKNAGTSSQAGALKKAGYLVHIAHSGKEALQLTQKISPDIIIYDATMMRSSGARTCRRLRNIIAQTASLIHCRAGGSENPHAEADAYLVHPFTSRKLLNRVKTLLPANELAGEIIRFGKTVFYKQKQTIDVDGTGEVKLTPKLALLLEVFLRHPNEVITRKTLMQKVWHTEYVGDTRTLDVHIRWIREHIEADPASPVCLRTIRGKGYLFEIPCEDASPSM